MICTVNLILSPHIYSTYGRLKPPLATAYGHPLQNGDETEFMHNGKKQVKENIANPDVQC
jgi:hypothetical protein